MTGVTPARDPARVGVGGLAADCPRHRQPGARLPSACFAGAPVSFRGAGRIARPGRENCRDLGRIRAPDQMFLRQPEASG